MGLSKLLFLAAANPIDGAERERIAAERERIAARAGPAAAKAEAAGDKEHIESINTHLQNYLNDVHESVTHERQRQAASDGPEAVKAALEGELKEAEKFHDTEHEKSILQHWVDYSHEAIPGKDGVPLAVMRQREAAEIDAKNGNSAATDAALAFQYKLAEEHGDHEHMHSIIVHQAHYERMAHQHHGKSLAQEHFTYFLWSP